ncbi:MAG TPA: ATP12 family protein [Alphaproteobacteria bacterium]|nr:ATP12 family protein [Alphaproteobacteria bacterium]
MRRLYKETATTSDDEGFAILLDGKPVVTPGRRRLVVPTAALAEGIASEWDEQGESIRPDTMPLMQIAATVLDHLAQHRPDVEKAVLRFAETDLVCYRADGPPELIRKQRAAWEPLLDWVAEKHGVRLDVTHGVLPVSQPSEAMQALGAIVRGLDDWRLGALQAAVSAAGSLVVGLALTEGRIDAAQAFAASELDESWSIDHWGEDAEAARRRAVVASDLKAARRFRDLLEA